MVAPVPARDVHGRGLIEGDRSVRHTGRMMESPHSCMARPRGPAINGVRIDPVTPGEFLERLDSFIRCGRSHVVHFCAAHPTAEARGDSRYRAVLNAGDLNVPDGKAVAWASRLSGFPARRLAGTEGFRLVADRGRKRGFNHYLFGGAEATLALLRRRLEEEYPGIAIAGAESPPFRPLSAAELAEAAGRIRSAGTHALWVGLGAPKQDLIAARLRDLDAAPVILCVGAAFDFVAGVKGRGPAWMGAMGLEWLFRLASEPRRLWKRYLLGNPRFVAGVLTDLLRRGREPSA